MLNANYSARSILRTLGTGQVQATAAIFAMQLPPRASDPDAASTIVIVNAMQRGLQRLGCRLQVNGYIDKATQNCLRQVAGPFWESRTWLSIGKDIIISRAAGSKLTPSEGHEGLGAAGFGGQAAALFITAGIAYLALRK